MCGICGIINFNNSIDISKLLLMTRILRHRGPDDEGFILGNFKNNLVKSFHHDETIDSLKRKLPRLENNLNANFGFGFRRLAILDLSENGHQPMGFEEAGLWIVFNGEIYNYIELREQLIKYGYKFCSNTDTEVILKAYHKWGEDCIHKFNGMWAFVIYDAKKNLFFCSRDRFGIKPFYYFYDSDHQFIFSSEIKSILQFIDFKPDLNTLSDYFLFGFSDHNERTFVNKVNQLRPGHNLIIKNGNLKIYQYYKIPQLNITDNFDKAKETIKELLYDAVRLRLRSDVPVGYALSGGVDSSSIVGIAAKINNGSNNTFSMIYPEDIIDESYFIKKVIEKTGVNHYFVTPAVEDFIKDLDDFIWHQEEPFLGLSYFGEFKLRELIRKNNVIVSLEGQGADEIITGYTSLLYPYFFDLLSNFQFYKFLKEYKLFKNYVNHWLRIINSYIKRSKKQNISYLSKKYPYLNIEYFPKVENHYGFQNEFNWDSYLNDKLYEMLVYTSIPQQLIRADKNAMAFSVECRFPFLDYRLVEYAINLPYDYKIKNGTTKYILREAMKDLLPSEVYKRKDKIGFAIPNNEFNTSIIKKHILGLLNEVEFDELPLLNKKKFMNEYFSKGTDKNLDWKFWSVTSIYLWFKRFISGSSK